MLDTAGKMLERLLLLRLNEHLDRTGQRAENQYGFRHGRSTEDALEHLLTAARGAARGAVQHRDLCVAVSLDVKNAFNSAPWLQIDSALCKRRVPPYLTRMIRSYLSDRQLLVGEELKSRTVTCGVPQGSVLGPALWNIFYDDLLDIELPAGVQMIAFADDVAVVGIASTGQQLERLVNPALHAISTWLRKNGLSLSPSKTEAIILTKKRTFTNPTIVVENHQIPIANTIKYLGLTMDSKFSFTAHISTAAKRATNTAKAIGRLMPNLGGPSQSKRLLLTSVVNSQLLYAAPNWAITAMKTAKNRRAIIRPQRLAALRVIRAYRTVSDDAALLLAGIPPADLLADERSRIKIRKQSIGPLENNKLIRVEERQRTINLWQTTWTRSTKAAWTIRLLPDVARWIRCKVDVSFHLTQALTCPHWSTFRLPVGQFVRGRDPTPEEVADLLCGPAGLPGGLQAAAAAARKDFINMVSSIISKKEEDERIMEAEARTRRPGRLAQSPDR